MAHYGFGHVNTYARKTSKISKGRGNNWSAKSIFGEAGREKENSPHVANPLEPQVVAGCHPSELEAKLDEYCEANPETYEKGGKTVKRPVRRDKHVLVAAVFSWPEHTDNFDEDRFNKFVADSIAFFEKEHGEVQSAVVHFDETHPHVHVYGFDVNARKNHPGWSAKLAVTERGGDGKEANEAYKQAMIEYQDRYFEQVSKPNGMDRLGPKRQRLTRKEWAKRKAELELNLIKEQAAEAQKKVSELLAQGEALIGEFETKHQTLQAQYDQAVTKLKASFEKQKQAFEEKIEEKKTVLDEAQAKVDEIVAKGGVKVWAQNVAYGILGRERPELEEARKLLEKERQALETEKNKAKAITSEAVARVRKAEAEAKDAKEDADAKNSRNYKLHKEVQALSRRVAEFEGSPDIRAEFEQKLADKEREIKAIKAEAAQEESGLRREISRLERKLDPDSPKDDWEI